MSIKIEVTDKTVDGAIEKGLAELGIKRDNAEIEVLGRSRARVSLGVAWKQDGQDIYRRQTRAAGIRGERSQYCSRHHGAKKPGACRADG